jgi:hypothetical protein
MKKSEKSTSINTDLMKKNILAALLLILTLTSCNVGVKKDLISGLNISNNGLSVEDAYLTVDSKKVSSSVPYGSTVILTIIGADGFTLKDGKAYPDASITVKTKTGETVASLTGLFDELAATGLDAGEMKKGVTLSLVCQDPLKMNEEYLCEFELKDKNGKGTIKISNTLKMQLLDGTTYKSGGITAKGIFYSRNNETTSLNEAMLSPGDKLNAYFSGLKGFKEENGNVWIDAAVSLQDKSGATLLEFKDLFADYDSTGIASTDAMRLITLSINTGEAITAGKEYKAVFILKDKKGSASLSNELSFKTK